MPVDDLKVAKKLTSLSSSAFSRGIDFDLSFKKVKQLLTRKTCYFTGIKFDKFNIRSIDRVDNTRGYVNDNVVACTKDFNEIKRDLTLKQIEMLYKKVFKHQGKL